MGLSDIAFRDGMTEGDSSVFRSPVTVCYWWVGACLIFHRYVYSPLVTEPNDYGRRSAILYIVSTYVPL